MTDPLSALATQTILVAGCGGFIGSHLVGRLLNAPGCKVLGIDRADSKIADCLGHPRFQFVRADSSQERALEPLVRNCDAVVHLAALCNPGLYNTVPVQVIESNFSEALPLLRLCVEHRKRLIFFSTSEVYGRTSARAEVLDEDETPLLLGPVPAQRWSYASAKQLLERLIYGYGQDGRLEFTIVRPFNFIGPRMDFIPGVDGSGVPRVLASFMAALLQAKPLPLVNGGRQLRTFTDIEDAVDAILLMLARPAAARNQIFNIGNPACEISIRDLALLMTDLFRELAPDRPPVEMSEVASEVFYGPGYEDSLRRLPGIEKARRLLGWQPRIGLRESLRRTMAWYLNHYQFSR